MVISLCILILYSFMIFLFDVAVALFTDRVHLDSELDL